MNGGEVLVDVMLSRGVDTMFFVPGGTNTTVMEALSRHQNKIRAVPTRLESSAAFACDAYAKFKKKPACMIASRSPGACNATVGVHSAMQSSRPMVFFISNIPKPQQGREAFQEINYHLMYKPIAKEVFDVHSFDELADVTARAFDLCISGRGGTGRGCGIKRYSRRPGRRTDHIQGVRAGKNGGGLRSHRCRR